MEDRVYPSYKNSPQAYKGFAYSYPLQQPDSPRPRRVRRRRRCCCSFSLLAIAVLLAIGAALVYFLTKPKALKYSVQDAAVTTFNLTSQNRLTTNIQFVIQAINPNKDVQFFFGNGSVQASYQGSHIGDGAVPAFQQLHKSTTTFPVMVLGRSVSIPAGDASDLRKGLSSKSAVSLNLNAKTNVMVQIGSLKSWKQKVMLSCYITIFMPSKSGEAQISSSSCKLKRR